MEVKEPGMFVAPLFPGESQLLASPRLVTLCLEGLGPLVLVTVTWY